MEALLARAYLRWEGAVDGAVVDQRSPQEANPPQPLRGIPRLSLEPDRNLNPARQQCQTSPGNSFTAEEKTSCGHCAFKKLTNARQLFAEHHVQHPCSTNLRLHQHHARVVGDHLSDHRGILAQGMLCIWCSTAGARSGATMASNFPSFAT